MSEAPDPLEAELSALRPREVSPDLRRRVAERLAEAPLSTRRWWWRLALAGALAAAGLAAALFWGIGGRHIEPEPVFPPAPAVKAEDYGPTVLAYERALARSPEELDALLNQHARPAAEPHPEPARLGAFTRSEVALHALLGED